MAYLTNAYPFELVPWRWVAEVVLYVLILRDGPSADLFSHAGRILVEGNAYLFAGLTRYPWGLGQTHGHSSLTCTKWICSPAIIRKSFLVKRIHGYSNVHILPSRAHGNQPWRLPFYPSWIHWILFHISKERKSSIINWIKKNCSNFAYYSVWRWEFGISRIVLDETTHFFPCSGQSQFTDFFQHLPTRNF